MHPFPVSIPRRRWLRGASTLAAAALCAPTLRAQGAYPSRPIKIIVPFSAGGTTDILARELAVRFTDKWKVSVVAENKAGAGGNLGADIVAKAAPDGYTLLLCDVGALSISPSVYTRLPFDPSKDLRGVTMLAYSPHLLVVHPSVPANNLKELVALSHQKDLNFAVTATGSAPHLAGIAVERATQARWQYVPYKGGAPAIQDTVGGQTQVLMNGMLATLPHVQSGKLKLLGVSRKTRMPLVGNVQYVSARDNNTSRFAGDVSRQPRKLRTDRLWRQLEQRCSRPD